MKTLNTSPQGVLEANLEDILHSYLKNISFSDT